jgi:SAM-dependent methyltransferase
MTPEILDMCCGSRQFWFDRGNPAVVFCDIRYEVIQLTDRTVEVKPDVVCDFRALPFCDGAFSLVVFDPPHLKFAGPRSFHRAKYGVLTPGMWRDDLAKGFSEAWRVLRTAGTLIFKWNESDVRLAEIKPLFPAPPAFGHTTGRHGKTHWVTFYKQRGVS